MSSEREPLSYLLLERYLLGELSVSERQSVEAHLAESATDRAVLEEILADQSELPPLPLTPLRPLSARRRVLGKWAVGAGLLAAAAAVMLLARRPSETSPGYDGVKGADVALRVIGERSGADPRTFAVGERFKVQVTCPPTRSAAMRLLVFQADEVFEPLPPAGFSCGNLAPWPGAFALDGRAPADVCVYWGDAHTPTREAAELTCTRLEAH
jgi:hypothetical protein